MISVLQRYFSRVLLFLWFGLGTMAVSLVHPAASEGRAYCVAISVIWCFLLAAILFLRVGIKTAEQPKRHYGTWEMPSKRIWFTYFSVSVMCIMVDYGLKATLYGQPQYGHLEVFPGFGLQSKFAPSDATDTLLTFAWGPLVIWLFGVGGLFYRYNVRLLDRMWFFLSAIVFGGYLCLSIERLVFGGNHDFLYLSGPLKYVCIVCGLKYAHMSSYLWTPADLFLSMAVFAIMIWLAAKLFSTSHD